MRKAPGWYKVRLGSAHAYADWLVKGDETAARRLVPVIVKNGTATPGLAQHAVAQLKLQGYTDVQNGGNALPGKSSSNVHLTGALAALDRKRPGRFWWIRE